MNLARDIRSAVKDFALGALYVTGALWLIAAVRLRRRTVVLTYHRVLPADQQTRSFSAPAIIVQPGHFDWQMRFLRKHFRPLTLLEFIEHFRSGRPLPSRSCLVTFDDGWKDTLEQALPILHRNRVPAVLFVATDYIGSGKCFWQERVSAVLHRLGPNPEVLRLLQSCRIGAEVSAESFTSRTKIRAIVDHIKKMPASEIEVLLSQLENLGGGAAPAEVDQFLDWNELAEIVRSGLMDIGSHAMSHRPLPQLATEDAGRELRDSRRIINTRLRVEPMSLAYPNGDADSTIADLAKSAGYEVAFTTRHGRVASDADRHSLARVNIHDGSSRTRAGFLARLVGII